MLPVCFPVLLITFIYYLCLKKYLKNLAPYLSRLKIVICLTYAQRMFPNFRRDIK